MDSNLPIQLLFTLILGAFIGLEREYHKDETGGKKNAISSLGVRTFSLLSLLGALAGVFFNSFLVLSIILSSGVVLLILCNYVLGTIHTKDSGITTEIAGIFSYLVGFILLTEVFPIQLTVAMTVIATLILSRKEEIKKTVARLHGFETNAFITYALIALVILPFLPDRSIKLTDIPFLNTIFSAYNVRLGGLSEVEIINPYKLWFLVALITGIDMLGYFLNKYMARQKGYFLSAMAGGFVSSTATTIALANESKNTKATNMLVASAVIANTASFFQLIALLAVTNNTLLVRSTIPLICIILAGIFCAFIYSRKLQAKETYIKSKIKTEVFSLTHALKFALIYLIVRFGSGAAVLLLGNSGVYLTTAIGALVGMDAVTLNLADLTARNIISLEIGVISIFIANAVNLLAKVFYSKISGNRDFTIKFGQSMVVIILSSILGIVFSF